MVVAAVNVVDVVVFVSGRPVVRFEIAAQPAWPRPRWAWPIKRILVVVDVVVVRRLYLMLQYYY